MFAILEAGSFPLPLPQPGEAATPAQAALRVATAVLVAAILSALVAIVYRATHKGMQYSRSFSLTLVMLAAVGTLVMLVIGDSLARAFGVFGALSLVRFRTAVKDPKDIAYVFLCLAIGMAAGTGAFLVAAVGTVAILGVIGILSVLRFGSRLRDDYLLRLVYRPSAEAAVGDKIAEVAKRAVLLTMQGYDSDHVVESTYLLTLKGRASDAVGAFQGVEGVTDVHMTATREELEL